MSLSTPRSQFLNKLSPRIAKAYGSNFARETIGVPQLSKIKYEQLRELGLKIGDAMELVELLSAPAKKKPNIVDAGTETIAATKMISTSATKMISASTERVPALEQQSSTGDNDASEDPYDPTKALPSASTDKAQSIVKTAMFVASEQVTPCESASGSVRGRRRARGSGSGHGAAAAAGEDKQKNLNLARQLLANRPACATGDETAWQMANRIAADPLAESRFGIVMPSSKAISPVAGLGPACYGPAYIPTAPENALATKANPACSATRDALSPSRADSARSLALKARLEQRRSKKDRPAREDEEIMDDPDDMPTRSLSIERPPSTRRQGSIDSCRAAITEAAGGQRDILPTAGPKMISLASLA